MAYNASQTKSPICYDLHNTDWQAVAGNYTFNFSTMRHRDKFLHDSRIKTEWMNDSMSRRFHMCCMFDTLALFQLYMQIEGRGFLVFDNVLGKVYESPEQVKFEVICDGA